MFERRKRAVAKVAPSTLDSLKLAFDDIVTTEDSWYDGTIESIDSRLAHVSAVLCDAEAVTARYAALSDRPGYGSETTSYEAGMRAAEMTESLRDLRRKLRMAQEAFSLALAADDTLTVSAPSWGAHSASEGRVASFGDGRPLTSDEVKEWDRWVATEPRRFLMSTTHTSAIRDHALAYADYHTSEIDNVQQKNQIMEAFADRVVELAS